jgi:hypothetical protein
MSQQHIDPSMTDPEEFNSSESEYRDASHNNYATPLSGEKIYPHSAPLSASRHGGKTISLVLWLAALFTVVFILLLTPTRIVTTTPDATQTSVVTNINGPYTIFVIVAFLLFSALLLVINLLISKRR